MNWTEQRIRNIVSDMASEDPMACRALIGIAALRFTESVPTMAISLSSSPVLSINLSFCRKYLITEDDVKCVLLHEFLHVLLDHHLQYKTNTRLLNIALDAIINAIIHRLKGPAYSDFFCRFYKWSMFGFLLRPRPGDWREYQTIDTPWLIIHEHIYFGKLGAEDLLELLDHIENIRTADSGDEVIFIGDHSRKEISEEGRNILSEISKRTKGLPVWSKEYVAVKTDGLRRKELQQYTHSRWRALTMGIIRRCVVPDKSSRLNMKPASVMLPVLSTEDRRAAVRFSSGGIIPFATHQLQIPHPTDTCMVYLDVSGSMNNVLPQLISLLYRFRDYLHRPFYTFSTEVFPAKFVNGKLEMKTTGGTQIAPVFDHIRKNKYRRALIITDGYVEKLIPSMFRGINMRHIHVLVSADGTVSPFAAMKMNYRQLPKN